MIKKYYDKVITALSMVSIFYCGLLIVDLFTSSVNGASFYYLIYYGLFLASAILILIKALANKLKARDLLISVLLFFISIVFSYTFTTSMNEIVLTNRVSNILWIALAVVGTIFYYLGLKNKKYLFIDLVILTIFGCNAILMIFASSRMGLIQLFLLMSFVGGLYLSVEEENEEE